VLPRSKGWEAITCGFWKAIDASRRLMGRNRTEGRWDKNDDKGRCIGGDQGAFCNTAFEETEMTVVGARGREAM